MFQSSKSEFIQLRGLRYHIRQWGDPKLPKLWMLHGWMDSSVSFQFLVDALKPQWHILAPDWRGFGLTQWPVAEKGFGHYWFHEYLADLEALLNYYMPNEAATLIGHSMGGNIASVYAGVRSDRVKKVVMLEAFGLLDDAPQKAARRIEKWLDAQQEMPKMGCYPSLQAAQQRLMKNDPFLSDERACFLAEHWTRHDQQGYQFLADPAHKVAGPLLFRLDELLAVWQKIKAPVLYIDAVNSSLRHEFTQLIGEACFQERFQAIADFTKISIEKASHMLHHDRPKEVALYIESFLQTEKKS